MKRLRQAHSNRDLLFKKVDTVAELSQTPTGTNSGCSRKHFEEVVVAAHSADLADTSVSANHTRDHWRSTAHDLREAGVHALWMCGEITERGGFLNTSVASSGDLERFLSVQ